MKKITLLGAMLFGVVTAFGQVTQVSELGDNNPVVIVEQEFDRGGGCSESNPGNAFENGFFNDPNSGGGAFCANDVTVPLGETFTLESVTMNQFHDVGATISSVDISYHEDNAGSPGTQIGSETLAPASQVVVGNNFGFDVSEVVLDVADFVFPGQAGSTTTYWINVQVTSSSGGITAWEGTTASFQGFSMWQFFNGAWTDTFFDGVYTFDGTCTLGLDDNALSQIAIFPNPADDVLNIRTPGGVEINNAVIYDVLGKASPVQVINGQINVQNLSRGVYILNLDTSAGTLTQKIVKQ